MVPLGQVARLSRGSAPAQIDRDKLERVATIEGNFQGRALTAVTGDIQTRLSKMELPPGYRLNFGGEQADFNGLRAEASTVRPERARLAYGLAVPAAAAAE